VDYWLYLMLVPALALVLIFQYGPLFGLQIAFKSYNIALGMLKSPWAGMGNFRYLFANPNFAQVIYNTVRISLMKLVVNFTLPVVVSILMNEMIFDRLKKTVQTLIYLPNFISWVVLGGVFINILSITDGSINQVIKAMGFQPVNFLGDRNVFPYTLVVTDAWKGFGYSTIIYMAALTSIDPSLYEAAAIDGAGRFRRMWHITLPGIVPIMVLVGTLSMGSLLNAGFDQVFNLYNVSVYSTGDILDTFTYRLGMVNAQYDVATAAGLVKSGVSLCLVSGSYFLAYKFADYRIF
jgi:putative aldouronate transport system permease protein